MSKAHQVFYTWIFLVDFLKAIIGQLRQGTQLLLSGMLFHLYSVSWSHAAT